MLRHLHRSPIWTADGVVSDEWEPTSPITGKLDAFDGVTVQPMAKRGGLEVILGSSLDPQFGPVVLFGSGGSLVEVYRDRALGLPPLNTTLARRMMEHTKIYQALQGVRGQKGVDMDALVAGLPSKEVTSSVVPGPVPGPLSGCSSVLPRP